MTPLHISSYYGHSNIVRELVTSNVDVNCVDHVSHVMQLCKYIILSVAWHMYVCLYTETS